MIQPADRSPFGVANYVRRVRMDLLRLAREGITDGHEDDNRRLRKGLDAAVEALDEDASAGAWNAMVYKDTGKRPDFVVG